jgi:hypothetical protein
MAFVREPAVKSIGKPDARNRHVRFDERGVKMEHDGDSKAPADERAGEQIGPV